MPNKKAKVAAIIPARWGSTRFPGKPLHLIAGKPLVQHVWERCREAKRLDEIVIATDDMRIAEAAFEFGADVALTSEKHRSGTDRIAEVAKKMKHLTHVLNVQGDEPLVSAKLLDRLVDSLVKTGAEMATAATPFAAGEMVDNPNAVKVLINRQGSAIYFSRSVIPFIRDAGMNFPYLRHQGIYAYSREFLLQLVTWKPTALEVAEQLEQLRAIEHGARIQVLVTKHASVGVDTPADAEAAARLLA
jgi:3-deoxy-manno-octulosonate cytidylyltransferase (CMP-KDO synthetase)